jgi:hypothetical protein
MGNSQRKYLRHLPFMAAQQDQAIYSRDAFEYKANNCIPLIDNCIPLIAKALQATYR